MQVLDRQTTTQPLTLVVGLDTKDLVVKGAIVEIVLVDEDRLAVQLDEGLRIGVEEGAICLEMDRASRAQDF